MVTIDNLKSDLKKYQTELAQLSSKRRCLREHIKKLCNDIYKHEREQNTIIVPNYITRDINLCKDYIIANPGCSSSDLITHLNNKLKNEYTRWKILNSNTYMTIMGNYLKLYCTMEKKKVNKRLTTVYYINNTPKHLITNHL